MKDVEVAKRLVKTIEDIWEANPELRFGQLITNAVREDLIYYAEDRTVLDLLCQYYKVDEGRPDRSIVEDIKENEKKIKKGKEEREDES